uniref:3'-5' exonuclease domain-containing protein n=1 Tax=Bicosoecida sp. CB-2014 TaxID=1486930 RepID=A0A7S1C7D2_9STRA|mmetsp:Transcript_14548/g.50687  ORF Transcript_14548/g.50687 Transcript_14548/m.50687 type:complete len:337 (+) Transcript_14548:3-1013(+)
MDDIRFIDTAAGVSDAVTALAGAASVALDLEGINLGRSGTPVLMQATAGDGTTIWLIDLAALGAAAFDTPGADAAAGTTMRDILAHATAPTAPLGSAAPSAAADDPRSFPELLLIDCRADNDALWAKYGVKLDAPRVRDLQLYDVAFRAVSTNRGTAPKHLQGGAKMRAAAVERGTLPPSPTFDEAAKALFAPELGGTYDVWLARPLDETLVSYAAADVAELHRLWAWARNRKWLAKWQGAIDRATAERVALCESPAFVAGDKENAFAPRMKARDAYVRVTPAARAGGGGARAGGGRGGGSKDRRDAHRLAAGGAGGAGGGSGGAACTRRDGAARA